MNDDVPDLTVPVMLERIHFMNIRMQEMEAKIKDMEENMDAKMKEIESRVQKKMMAKMTARESTIKYLNKEVQRLQSVEKECERLGKDLENLRTQPPGKPLFRVGDRVHIKGGVTKPDKHVGNWTEKAIAREKRATVQGVEVKEKGTETDPPVCHVKLLTDNKTILWRDEERLAWLYSDYDASLKTASKSWLPSPMQMMMAQRIQEADESESDSDSVTKHNYMAD